MTVLEETGSHICLWCEPAEVLELAQSHSLVSRRASAAPQAYEQAWKLDASDRLTLHIPMSEARSFSELPRIYETDRVLFRLINQALHQHNDRRR